MNVSALDDNQSIVFQTMTKLDASPEDISAAVEYLGILIKAEHREALAGFVLDDNTKYFHGGIELNLVQPVHYTFDIKQYAQENQHNAAQILDYKLKLNKALETLGFNSFDYSQYVFHVIVNAPKDEVFVVIQREHEELRQIELLEAKRKEDRKSILLVKEKKIQEARLRGQITEAQKNRNLGLVKEAEAA
jgi:hypothetical protein